MAQLKQAEEQRTGERRQDWDIATLLERKRYSEVLTNSAHTGKEKALQIARQLPLQGD